MISLENVSVKHDIPSKLFLLNRYIEMDRHIRKQLPRAAILRIRWTRQCYFAKFRLANAIRWQIGHLCIQHRAPWLEYSARALHPQLFN